MAVNSRNNVSCNEPAMVYVLSPPPSFLRRLCLSVVNPFHFAQELWLDRLVVAGAAGRSCLGAPVVLGADDQSKLMRCKLIDEEVAPHTLNVSPLGCI